MKKKLLFGALGALFLGAGIFTATNLQEKEQISDLTLANIEAMTGNDNRDTAGDLSCRWHYIGKHNSACIQGGEGYPCECGLTTHPLK